MNDYQLIIIGSGPAGYESAIRAAQLGLKTALVEKRDLGGTCLNRGCIPTKTMLHSAIAYAEVAHYEKLGLFADNVSYDMEKIRGRMRAVTDQLRKGVEQLLAANKVTVLRGKGTVIAHGKVQVGGETYTADHILIATGSYPARPPIPGLNLPGVVTSDEVLEEGPAVDYKSLVIIGGGFIGVELASIYAALGCKVTIVEALDRLLSNMDREIAQNLNMIFKKRGVEIFCGARVERIEATNYGLTCHFTQKETEKSVTAQGVLVAIGRRPNTDGLFSEDVVPEMEGGFIKVNDKYESSIPGLYAVGDVIGGIQLAHKAATEGLAAVEMMCGHTPKIDPHLVPAGLYTNPEIASVGITLDEAKKEGRAVKIGKYLMSGNARSIINIDERGFVKLIFDAETDQLLGVQMMCARATDLIGEFTGHILNGTTRAQLLRGMRPHPSFCEGITEAIEAVEGKSIHSAPVCR